MNTRYITAEDGSKTDVVLPVAEYESLMEDLQDLAVIAERRDEADACGSKRTIEDRWAHIG